MSLRSEGWEIWEFCEDWEDWEDWELFWTELKKLRNI